MHQFTNVRKCKKRKKIRKEGTYKSFSIFFILMQQFLPMKKRHIFQMAPNSFLRRHIWIPWTQSASLFQFELDFDQKYKASSLKLFGDWAKLLKFLENKLTAVGKESLFEDCTTEGKYLLYVQMCRNRFHFAWRVRGALVFCSPHFMWMILAQN